SSMLDPSPTQTSTLSLHDALPILHGSRAGDALDRPVERLDPPRRDVVHVDVERGLVELEDVEPERGKLARLLVDETRELQREPPDRKSTRLNSSHEWISYAVFCLK